MQSEREHDDSSSLQPTLAANLELLIGVRRATLATAARLSQQQLDYREAPDRWTAGEILDHLVLAEGYFVSEIATLIALARSGREPLLRRDLTHLNTSIWFIPKSLMPWVQFPAIVANLFLPRWLRDLMLRSRLTPIQAPEFLRPRAGRAAAELQASLADGLIKTERMFAEAQNLDFDRMRLTHPMLGSNTVPQVLHFVVCHEQRHQAQLASVIASPGFPGP